MIIVDTGAFLALFNKRDTYHVIAQQAFRTLSEPLITTYPVITETSYLLAQFVNHTVQRNFLKAICQNAFGVFQIEQNHLKRMIELMERYADLPMDLTRSSLVILAEHLEDGRILTVDKRDFNTYRWKNTKPFQNLLFDP